MKLRPSHLRGLLAASRATLPLASAVVLGAAAMACSANVGAETGSASSSQRLAVVDVRVQQEPGTELVSRFDASARFVSVREAGGGGSAGALGLLGLAWSPVPVGVCTLDGGEPASAAAPVRVDLRDLSPVSLELRADSSPSSTLRLDPHAFPDVGGMVSGVVFVAPSDAASAIANARWITLHVGAGNIGELELPDLPTRLQLDDAIAGDQRDTYLVNAGGLDLSASSLARADDRLVVDVVRGGVVRARCGADTTGRLHIDASALGGAGDASLLVRVQRRVLRDDASVGPVDARFERNMELKLVVR